jgi:hypothetical protein
MSKKLSVAIGVLLAVGAIVVIPAVAQAAEPEFKINGALAGEGKTDLTYFSPGTLTFNSPFLGEIKCKVIAGAPIWNQGGRGLGLFEGWEPYLCTMPGTEQCQATGGFLTAEAAVELKEKENAKKEKEYSAKRGPTSLPWQVVAKRNAETGKVAEQIQNIKLLVNCPAETLEIPYEGTLEPFLVNGSKNGLHPSHLEFEGKGGKTGHLVTRDLGNGGELEEADLFVSGEMILVGEKEQLISAE